MRYYIQITSFVLFSFVLGSSLFAQTTDSFTTPGAQTWTCPVGVTSATVTVYGGGGGGGGTTSTTRGCGGGGGGGASQSTLVVVPGVVYNLEVGAGGAGGSGAQDGAAGGQSWFNSAVTIQANGGSGGLQRDADGGEGGNGAAAGIGTSTFTGGNGANGRDHNNGRGGGGGGGAGDAANGSDASGATTTFSNSGGAGGVTGGGDGATSLGIGNNGVDGATIGGGGSGSSEGTDGGSGARGQVDITYTLPAGAEDGAWPGQDLGTLTCPSTTNQTGSTTGANQDCGVSSAGDHIYQFTIASAMDLDLTLCNAGTDYDTQVHLFNLTNGNCTAGAIATNDDGAGCGTESRIQSAGLAAGTYVIVIEGWSTSEGNYDMDIILTCPAGCTSDMSINTTTSSNAGLTTCGFGDDYSSADACGSDYMGGDDIVIEYTPTTTECVNVTLTNTDTWTGVFILDDCPDQAGASCLASNTNSAGNPAITGFNVTAGTTYYIVVSTWPAPQCTAFDLDIIACPAAPANDLCADAIDLPCGTVAMAGTTVGASNIADGTGCTISDYGVWYSFTGDGQSTTVTCTPEAGYDIEIGYTVIGTCAGFTCIGCVDDNGAGTSETVTIQTTLGEVYYFYIAHTTSTSTATGTFTMDRTCTLIPVTAQDCGGGTTICSDATFVGNSSGSGNILDITGCNYGCLSSGENESSWYYFEASAAGDLEFGIQPQNGTDDYDFALWGPYPTGSVPSNICPPAGTPARCSYAAGAPGADGTGLQIGSGDTSEDSFGDHLVDEVSLATGDVYILMVDNYTGSGSPFDFNITASAGLSLDCTPLYIELLKFNGLPFDGYNQLLWTTSSEINNEHFVIEKSHDGIIFAKLGEIAGAGNSNQILNYAYYDHNPYEDITYYRLKQVDFDGKHSYSHTVAIKQSMGADVSIYPNPSKGDLNINFVSKESDYYDIVISNVSKVVLSESAFIEKGNQHLSLDSFKNLAAGLYFIKITDHEGKIIKVDKVVKQ